MNEPFQKYDSADYLKTEEDIAAYLNAVMENHPSETNKAYAQAVVARARARMHQIHTASTYQERECHALAHTSCP